jgi:biotin carboxylase
MNKKKVMIFGAGVFQIDAIKTAKSMGLEVIAIDANPDAPGFPLADYYEVVSTTDINAALEVARRYDIDGLMTMATDTCVPAVAIVAEELELAGISIGAARRATNKLLMRQSFESAGVPSPRFEKVENLSQAIIAIEKIGLPAMLKIPDSSGSRGIRKITGKEQLESVFISTLRLSKSGFLLIEQFIGGVEVGGEAFFFNDELIMFFITNKAITPPPYYVPYGHSLPSGLDNNVQYEIQKVVHNGSRALGIKSGPVNFDVMVSSRGIEIIELGARLGGTCLPSIVKYHSGIDTVEAAIMMAIGEDPSNLFQPTKSIPVAVRLITSDKDGILTRVKFPDDINNRSEVLEYTIDVEEGGHVKAFTCGAHRFGHIICRGTDYSRAERNAGEVLEASDFEIVHM